MLEKVQHPVTEAGCQADGEELEELHSVFLWMVVDLKHVGTEP